MIHTIAQQKFEYQDIVCIEMMLRFWDMDGARFQVEPEGGEDGELIFPETNVPWRFEIQVKGTKHPVGLDLVATCLAHTPAHMVANTLLERLIADPCRLAVLVVSSHCKDEVYRFVVSNWVGKPHANDHITKDDTTKLLDAFKVANIPGRAEEGTLKTKRQDHNTAFVCSANREVVRSALHRLIILEKADKIQLECQCEDLLKKNHGIPGDRTKYLLYKLQEAVRIAKKDAVDAYPLVRKIITNASPMSLQPVGYINRGIEEELSKQLSDKRVLLLCGIPGVGKTFTARHVAESLRCHGYDIQEFSDINMAAHFLEENTQAFRLVLLDSPLGYMHVIPEAQRALDRIERLIHQLRPHRRLVVVQSVELLRQVAPPVPAQKAIVTAGHCWTDLSSVPSSTFLVALWTSLCADVNTPEPLHTFVREQLDTGTLVLEPRCLEYLAQQKDLPPLTIEGVTRVARTSASELGRALVSESKDYEHLLIGLALTTSERESVGLSELAFVGCVGGEASPDKTNKGIGIGGLTCERLLELTPPAREALDTLEQRRLLVSDKGSVNFTYPFYRSAAESLLDRLTTKSIGKVIETLKRGLLCSSPITSRATARKLGWVFNTLTLQNVECNNIFEYAEEGLRTLYPATRDLCFRFLVHHSDSLPSKIKYKLPELSLLVTSIKLVDCKWKEGQAYISREAYFGSVDYAYAHCQDIVKKQKFFNEAVGISPEYAANMLVLLKTNPTMMTKDTAGKLFSYDEAVIRAETMRIWLADESRSEDKELLERMFADDHPSCMVAAYESVSRNFDKFTVRRQHRLRDNLVAMVNNPVAAMVFIEKNIFFIASPEMIRQLLPVILSFLPKYNSIITNMLFSMIWPCSTISNIHKFIGYCHCLLDIKEYSKEKSMHCYFNLGEFTIVIIKVTYNDLNLRAKLIVRALSLFSIRDISLSIDKLFIYWQSLTLEGQNEVIKKIMAEDPNRVHFQAVALTHKMIPSTVQAAILGQELNLKAGAGAGAEELISGMPVDLLKEVLLYWRHIQGCGWKIWELVIERLARMPDHPLFEVALKMIASKKNDYRLANAIKELKIIHAEQALDILYFLRCDGFFIQNALRELLSMAPTDEIYRLWQARMALPCLNL